MSTGFREISRNAHLPTRVAEEIAREIAAGRFAPGERLPTENVLSAAFGVSRSVVREAIAQLRNEGVVETRQGVGAFVTDPRRRATLRVEPADLADPANLRAFFQLRLPLEIEAARLAARHRRERDVDVLGRALADMTEAAGDWLRDGVQADLAFHRALASATGNEYYETFLSFIGEKFSSTIHSAFPRPVRPEIVQVTIDEHRAVFEAVAAGDPARAGEAMRAHLTGAASRFTLSLED